MYNINILDVCLHLSFIIYFCYYCYYYCLINLQEPINIRGGAPARSCAHIDSTDMDMQGAEGVDSDITAYDENLEVRKQSYLLCLPTCALFYFRNEVAINVTITVTVM